MVNNTSMSIPLNYSLICTKNGMDEERLQVKHTGGRSDGVSFI